MSPLLVGFFIFQPDFLTDEW